MAAIVAVAALKAASMTKEKDFRPSSSRLWPQLHACAQRWQKEKTGTHHPAGLATTIRMRIIRCERWPQRHSSPTHWLPDLLSLASPPSSSRRRCSRLRSPCSVHQSHCLRSARMDARGRWRRPGKRANRRYPRQGQRPQVLQCLRRRH